MINTTLIFWVRSIAIASTATVLMLALLIVGAEEAPDLKSWLKATFYHHWLGKGALALILFALTALIVRFKGDATKISRYIFLEAWIVILSVAIIAGYYLLHVLKIV